MAYPSPLLARTLKVFSLGTACALGSGLVIGLLLGFRPAQKVLAQAPQATFAVTNTSDSGPGSLREAILNANASPGADSITISAAGTITLLSPLPTITETVAIQGPGAGTLAVDGVNSYRVFDIDSVAVSLADLSIQHGNVTGTSANGAGIRSTGILTLTSVHVLTNTAQSSGGGMYVNNNLTVIGGLIQGNHSTNGNAGGLRACCNTTIDGTHFVGNIAPGDGGGAFLLGVVRITNGHFQGNQCTTLACDGGGLFSFSDTILEGTSFVSNTAQDHGGGLATAGILTITNSLFEMNQSLFSSGGGLYAQDVADLQDTRFLSNTARSFGGGMYGFAAISMVDSVFEANQSLISLGGGLAGGAPGATARINRVQFLRNSAAEGGGFYHTQGDARLENSLFAGNRAVHNVGTALLLASPGSVDVVHSTYAGQASGSGPAIEVSAGTVGITNTIISGYTTGISNTGGAVVQDFNLYYANGLNTQGVISGGASSLTGNPLFVDPAGDNFRLGLGSLAIDAGINAGLAIDFEGQARPLDAGFDIGFDEVDQGIGTPTPALTPTPVPASTPIPQVTPGGTSANYLYLPTIQK